MILEKYYFNNDIEIYSNNSYYVESDKEYYDKKCIDLFLATIKKNMINLFFKKIRKDMRNFFKLGTLKFPPKI